MNKAAKEEGEDMILIFLGCFMSRSIFPFIKYFYVYDQIPVELMTLDWANAVANVSVLIKTLT